MTIKRTYQILIAIFIVGLLLRLIWIDKNPVGFHVDEVNVGWNAYSILKSGVDSHGNSWPLYYNSFGDFRPTGYFYLTIPSLIAFGNTVFAVRFPGVLFGSLTIISIFFLTRIIFKKDSVALLASLFLALSPWHMSLSRASSEGIATVFLTITGLYFFIKAIQKKSYLVSLISVLFFFISYFFYHTARLLTPIFLIATTIYYIFQNSNITSLLYGGKKLKNIQTKIIAPFKPVLIAIIVMCLITVVFASDKQARGRFDQVSIFKDLDVHYALEKMPYEEGDGSNVFAARFFHNKVVVYSVRFMDEYVKYFSPSFYMTANQAHPSRYLTTSFGLLTQVELIFLLFGLISMVRGKTSKLPLILLLLSPLPAALTTEDSPNLHRSIFLIPFIAMISAAGFWSAKELLWGKFRYIVIFVFVLFLLNNFYFWHLYFKHNQFFPSLIQSRNVGATELAQKLDQIQGDYNKIYITSIPDKPYPWYAYFTKQNPDTFNNQLVEGQEGLEYKNIVFTGQRCPNDIVKKLKPKEHILIIEGESCNLPENEKDQYEIKKVEQINRPDGTTPYIFVSVSKRDLKNL